MHLYSGATLLSRDPAAQRLHILGEELPEKIAHSGPMADLSIHINSHVS